MKTQRNIALITLVTIALLMTAMAVSLVFAQDDKVGPPPPVPPIATVELCGNYVYSNAEMVAAVSGMQAQGCTDIRFQYLYDGYWIGYGTKINIVN